MKAEESLTPTIVLKIFHEIWISDNMPEDWKTGLIVKLAKKGDLSHLIGSQASFQNNCNREGFNVESDSGSSWPKARIGILFNNEDDCRTCDSRIGFGFGGKHFENITCGIVMYVDSHIKAMG